MNKELKRMEDFIYLDIEIKKLLNALNPYTYSKLRMANYSKDVLKGIETCDKTFKKISELFEFSDEIKERINFFFNVIMNEALKNNNNLVELEDFTYKRLHKLEPSFIHDVKLNCYGYNEKNSYQNDPILESLLTKAQSVNEFIHAIHSYIMNNEKYYQNIPELKTKLNQGNYPIVLRGIDVPIAQELFKNFPLDGNIGWTDILSLNKNILMMIRDKGHALTIDINLENMNCIIVSYFIPKICNVEMAKKIKGIDNQNLKLFQSATGKFETNNEKFIKDIVEFIKSVPTDLDIKIEENELLAK